MHSFKHLKPLLCLLPLGAVLTGCFTAPTPGGGTGGGSSASDFVINSPANGSKVASPIFFSVQPFNAGANSTVKFMAGDKELTVDNDYEDKFKVFLDPNEFPTGPLNLTATLTNGGQQATQSVTVQLINPADLEEQATVGSDGAILGTPEENGAVSVFTVPPGSGENARVSFEARTKAEVKSATGVDYDALGVTFLGAQEVQSSQPLNQRTMVASGGFGPQVQPGQAVVQYVIAPDADGDGLGELVVVNTASVAPNGDVVSDPIPTVQAASAQTIDSQGRSQIATLQSGISVRPGDIMEVDVTGMNAFSLASNIATFRSVQTQEEITSTGVVKRDPSNPDTQKFRVIVPSLPTGSAEFFVTNLTTNTSTPLSNLSIQPALPLSSEPKAVIQAFLNRELSILQSLDTQQDNMVESAIRKIEQVGVQFDKLYNLNDPAAKDMLQKIAVLVSTVDLSSNSANLKLSPQLTAYTCEELKNSAAFWGAIAAPSLAIALGANVNVLVSVPALIIGGLSGTISIIKYGIVNYQGNGCDDPEIYGPIPIPPLPPPPLTTGMGSAAVPGGVGAGIIAPSFSTTPTSVTSKIVPFQNSPSIEGRYQVKVYINNQPLPFTGLSDEGGYFAIPLIPEAQPFTARAIDRETGQFREFEGIGPAISESVYMFFDFSEDVAAEPIEISGTWAGTTSSAGSGDSYFTTFVLPNTTSSLGYIDYQFIESGESCGYILYPGPIEDTTYSFRGELEYDSANCSETSSITLTDNSATGTLSFNESDSATTGTLTRINVPSGSVIGGFDLTRGGISSIAESEDLARLRGSLRAGFPNVSFTGSPTLTTAYLSTINVLILSNAFANYTLIDPLSAEEQAALRTFVSNGGTALIFGENSGFAENGANENLIDPFGLDMDGNLNGSQDVTISNQGVTPVTSGPFGTVLQMRYNRPGYFTNLAGAQSVAALVENGQSAMAYFPKGQLGAGSAIFFSDANVFLDYSSTAANNSVIRNALLYAASSQ